MKYYLDCEFEGYGGMLLSLALVREDGKAFHTVSTLPISSHLHPWVRENVIPNIRDHLTHEHRLIDEVQAQLQEFLAGDPAPHVIADWPEDFVHLVYGVLTGPGTMINIPRLTMEVVRVDAYPTTLPGMKQHNAYCDAMALRHKLQGGCLTCAHRPYGDHRLHVDCMIFEGFWSKNKPKPKNGGADCPRYEQSPPPFPITNAEEKR